MTDKPTKISQKEFYRAVADDVGGGVTLAAVTAVLDNAQDWLLEYLNRGDTVQLSIGQFKRADKAERKGINSFNGEKYITPAKNAAKFVPGKRLKDHLN